VCPVTTTDAPARRLIEGLAACIRTQGYADTTVADIVREARTSRRTFYEHFGDRQECLVALLYESNQRTIARIAAAVGQPPFVFPHGRQAIEGWIAAVQADPPITLSWIRDVPALGEGRTNAFGSVARRSYVQLIQDLTDTPHLRAAGVRPPSEQLATILLGGLRELIATAVEDGHDVATIVAPAVEATQLMLGPRT